MQLHADAEKHMRFLQTKTRDLLQEFVPRDLCTLILEYKPCPVVRISKGRKDWNVCICNGDQLILYNRFSRACCVSDTDDQWNRELSIQEQKNYASGGCTMQDTSVSNIFFVCDRFPMEDESSMYFKNESISMVCSPDGEYFIRMLGQDSPYSFQFQMGFFDIFTALPKKDKINLSWTETFPMYEIHSYGGRRTPKMAIDWDADMDFGAMVILTADRIHLRYFDKATGFLSWFLCALPVSLHPFSQPEVALSIPGSFIALQCQETESIVFIPLVWFETAGQQVPIRC